MSQVDRLKGAFFALVRAAMPAVDYYALYRARVVSQSGDLLTLDLQPDDDRLPGMSHVPIKMGIPGATARVRPGAYVLVGWEGGDPARPHALVWESGAIVLDLTFAAADIKLGASATQAIVRGAAFWSALSELVTTLQTFASGTASASSAAQIATAATPVAAACATFLSGASSYLSTVSKTE